MIIRTITAINNAGPFISIISLYLQCPPATPYHSLKNWKKKEKILIIPIACQKEILFSSLPSKVPPLCMNQYPIMKFGDY
jgi:hypothetical protein